MLCYTNESDLKRKTQIYSFMKGTYHKAVKPSVGAGTNLPSGNFRMFATDEYSYLIGLDQVSWHDALTRCPRYGDGYYLANINSGEEFELLRNYFRDLSIAGALCCLKYFFLI